MSETEAVVGRNPNPRRVSAGARNRARRGGLTEEGRQRLCEAAHRNRPWLHSTGPRTAQGKARSAENGRLRQIGPRSIRQIRSDLASLRGLIEEMRQARAAIGGA
jgi:hypothetical protein